MANLRDIFFMPQNVINTFNRRAQAAEPFRIGLDRGTLDVFSASEVAKRRKNSQQFLQANTISGRAPGQLSIEQAEERGLSIQAMTNFNTLVRNNVKRFNEEVAAFANNSLSSTGNTKNFGALRPKSAEHILESNLRLMGGTISENEEQLVDSLIGTLRDPYDVNVFQHARRLNRLFDLGFDNELSRTLIRERLG